MTNPPLWMVRAGKGGVYADDFLDEDFVGIGFRNCGTVDDATTKAQMLGRMRAASPNPNPRKLATAASQVLRFCRELEAGHRVMTYNPSARRYFLGELTGDVTERDHDLFRTRPVRWTGQVHRDSLTDKTRRQLGAISTLFLVNPEAAAELERLARPPGDATEPPPPAKDASGPVLSEDTDGGDDIADLTDDAAESADDIETRAEELIDDRLAGLGWEDLQELVAEILRAMNFRAQTSERGPDRGVDVIASPDGLGLTEPRIFVEVKHRPGTRMSAPDIRSFLGGRQAGDRCLYVSTGGFTREARYEADRSNVPVTLIDLPRLRELLLEHYERFSVEGLKLVPLRRVYWVV